MAPYFSVILPVYNVERYLERCIRSVLEQSFQDYELILVDDGSRDGSGKICDDYAARYNHIRVVHKANGGLSSARNAGTDIARGTYIWWVDSDDWIAEGALARLYDVTRQRQPDMVKFNHVRVTQSNTTVISCAAPGVYSGREQMDILMDQALRKTGKYGLSACMHIYKTAFLKKQGFRFVSEREVGSEDYLLNLQALPLAGQLVVLEDALYFYEMRMGSLTMRHKVDSPPKYTALYRQLREFYSQEGLLSRYERQINTFYVWHLLHGICLPNEYYVCPEHSLAEGRRNIRAFLRLPEAKQAIRNMDRSGFSAKRRLQLLAMRWHMEPVFYWLYVVKPRLRKG